MRDIKVYNKLEINFQNGVVTIVSAIRKKSRRKSHLMSFAGAGQGCWGDTPDEVKNIIQDLRDS